MWSNLKYPKHNLIIILPPLCIVFCNLSLMFEIITDLKLAIIHELMNNSSFLNHKNPSLLFTICVQHGSVFLALASAMHVGMQMGSLLV